ncbi:MAG: hypothetical protein DHS20C02_06730 [Micavibrio sp.]|nr:MAG: hypothetical protein DHS20C02_06730 [Micavibrio sp.]
MLGANKMMIGLLLCVFGVAIMVAKHYVDIPHVVTLFAFGAITVGGILFILGLLFSVFVHAKGEKGIHRDDAAVSAMALIRCMIATSIADDHLDDREIKTIAKIYTQLTGSPMNEETIRETADHMKQEGTDILGELANIKDIMDKDLKTKILKASLFILAADGVVNENEEYILEAIRRGLGISKMKFKGIKTKFLSSKDLS